MSDSGLLTKWKGPYEVLRKMGHTNYEICLPDRWRKNKSFMYPGRAEQANRQTNLLDEEESIEQYPTVSVPFVLPDLGHLSSGEQKNLRSRVPEGVFIERPGRTELMQKPIRLLTQYERHVAGYLPCSSQK